MKYIYFVRHGESLANAGEMGVGTDSPLTQKGTDQATFAAERCVRLPIELVIASTLLRAQQTAQIIISKIHKPLETVDMFRERRGPSAFNGISEAEWTQIRKGIKGYFYAPGFHHSDEENFEDVMTRAAECLKYLKTKNEKHILVIAHGSFLRDLISLAIFKGGATPDIRRKMSKGFLTTNTGLTILTHDEPEDEWSLLTWNDHAHLG